MARRKRRRASHANDASIAPPWCLPLHHQHAVVLCALVSISLTTLRQSIFHHDQERSFCSFALDCWHHPRGRLCTSQLPRRVNEPGVGTTNVVVVVDRDFTGTQGSCQALWTIGREVHHVGRHCWHVLLFGMFRL